MLNLSKLNMAAMERHERISEAISQCPLSRGELAQRIQVSESSLTQWTKGETKNLKLENLFKLADATGYSARWIALESGPKFSSETQMGVSEDQPLYRINVSKGLRKIIDRLISMDQRSELPIQLITALDSVINASTPGVSGPAAKSDFVSNREISTAELGLDDDPELVDLTEHLQSAMTALDQFRARRMPITLEQATNVNNKTNT